jgi:hypothetical protein
MCPCKRNKPHFHVSKSRIDKDTRTLHSYLFPLTTYNPYFGKTYQHFDTPTNTHKVNSQRTASENFYLIILNTK